MRARPHSSKPTPRCVIPDRPQSDLSGNCNITGIIDNHRIMRPHRIIVPPDMDGLYHVVSRVVDRRMIFGEEESSGAR